MNVTLKMHATNNRNIKIFGVIVLRSSGENIAGEMFRNVPGSVHTVKHRQFEL